MPLKKIMELAIGAAGNPGTGPAAAAFSMEVGAVIPHGSVSHANDEEEVELAAGHKAKFSSTHGMVVEERGLGLLTVSRGKPFADDEIATLKHLLCALAYPLRNALTYRRVVRASITDPSTGVFNRTVMETSLRREVALSKRHKIPLSLLILDIDGFKAINDEHGHEMGDMVLIAVTDSISHCLRKTDILLSNTNKKGAKTLARHITKELKDKDYPKKDSGLKVTVSIGIAFLARGENTKPLFKRADQTLYKAKGEGRNRVRIAS